MKKIILFLLIISISLYARKVYTVTIEPQKFFLEKIGQSKIRVKTLYENINFRRELEHVYFRRFAYSDVYFTIGLAKEERYKKELLGFNEDLKIVDISKNIDKLKHNGKENPYFWTDPISVNKAIKVMLDVLIENDPLNKEYFESNYQTLLRDLDRIFLRLKETLFYTTKAVYVFDEKWDYFLSRFDVRAYKAENELLGGKSFTEVFRNSRELDIKYLIVDDDIDYEIYNSWSLANNMTVLKADIYSYNWFADLFVLSEQIRDNK